MSDVYNFSKVGVGKDLRSMILIFFLGKGEILMDTSDRRKVDGYTGLWLVKTP